MKKKRGRFAAAAAVILLAAAIGWLAYEGNPAGSGESAAAGKAGSAGNIGNAGSVKSAGNAASSGPTAGFSPVSSSGGEADEPASTGTPQASEVSSIQASAASSSAPVSAATPSPSPAAAASPSPGAAAGSGSKLVPYRGTVEHIFFHPLIVYPELAFDGDSMAQGYFDWFVTVQEFRSILADLYRNNYILIRLDALYGTRAGKDGKPEVYRQELLLPEGKKPLILSVDDNNYYDYMRQNGNIQKLVVAEDGRVAGYAVDPEGNRITARDNEIVPLVDDFVAAHPDFSFNGAKGVLALTGYEGVLGYRTNDPSSPAYAEEKAGAEQVIRQLKATGWTFASHGWGHRDANKITHAHLAQDTDRWLKEVGPLIGPTDVYIYPFGSSVDRDAAKLKLLKDRGFKVFCSVGPLPYLKITSEAMFMDRRHIDGMALTQTPKRLAPLFDAAKALDPARPKAK